MKLIKKYKFFKEKYQIPNTDAPELSSDKSTFNDLEFNILQYNQKKNVVQNIYMTYTDQQDLINKLFNQKFINKKTTSTTTTDPKKFLNPLLGLWAQVCEKMRAIKDIQDKISSEQDTIDQKQDLASQNPGVADSTNQDIKSSNDKISDYKSQLSQLNTDITDLENQIRIKLQKMKVELSITRDRINKSIS